MCTGAVPCGETVPCTESSVGAGARCTEGGTKACVLSSSVGIGVRTGEDSMPLKPAPCASSGVDAGGSRKSRAAPWPFGYLKQKGNMASSKMM
jgi:hypothetical protein